MGEQSGEGEHDPHLPRLADRRAVGQALRGAPRPRRRARGARRRPRRPRGRQGPHHRVPRRAQAAPGPRHRGRPQVRRDPHADRSSRHRQDLDRRVDRPRDRARVRAHVARRRARRGRDPRPPAHLHRRAAGPPGARPARRRDDEPGDPARRGRQGRRRLARRPVRGAARGPRPRAEPLVPRPLPRRRARPLPGRVHRHGQRGRHDPRPAARPHGGDPLRRLHHRREGRDRQGLPVAAPARPQRPARGRGRRSPTTCCARSSPSTRARPACASLERELGTVLRKTATKIASGKAEAPVDDRPRRRARRARPPEGLPGVGGAHGRAGRRHGPGGHRRRRRRAVHRGDRHEERR